MKKTPECFGRWSDVCKEDCHCEKSDEDLCFAAENDESGAVIVVEEVDAHPRCHGNYGGFRRCFGDGFSICANADECRTSTDAEGCVAITEEGKRMTANPAEGCVVVIGEAECHDDILDHYSKHCFGQGSGEMGGCALSCHMSGGPAHLCLAYTRDKAHGAVAVEYEEDA